MDRPLRACAVPGCPHLFRDHCPTHGVKVRESMYDHRWSEVAAGWLIAYPYCVRCGGWATEVDHIIPLTAGGRRLDRDNLRSLCHPCHSKITAATRSRATPPGTYRRRLTR